MATTPTEPTGDGDRFGVGVAIPMQGAGGIFGPSCRSTVELAVHEINSAGGILGREVELVVLDAGRSPRMVARELDGLIRQGYVHAVTGWHTSLVRDAIVAAVAGRIPYIFTALHEGLPTQDVVTVGEVPTTQVAPALAWLCDNFAVPNWSIVGNDYVWPRFSSGFVENIAPSLGITVSSLGFASFGDEPAISALLDTIERESPDAVAMFLVGQDAVLFNREFARRGLDRDILRYSPLMDESMLMGSGIDGTANLYSSAGYFRSIVSANTLDLQSRYAAFHGPFAPTLNNTAESCYEGMLTLAHLVSRAQSTDMTSIKASIGGLAYDGPRGVMQYQGAQGFHDIYLARADGYDFEVLSRI
ncbi:substrate-binding domain-containing protein [Rhodococcoides kyotonense]|uniref:ABC-type branched-chain amino acid transport system, substrate-binding protein n=1 Tax=Rhodococcoides kyotonense TaxID=398843 RepID=A0A239LGJ2_9NOCA|nr:substrate-binding domain-containing protein [Rhodococcus kyotonensis]SNT29777.1 ABC-type branched-chain amino acid transport system, substrate-binding protein [Rhodococcus kyotonensis]